jgi:hypothetical protein
VAKHLLLSVTQNPSPAKNKTKTNTSATINRSKARLLQKHSHVVHMSLLENFYYTGAAEKQAFQILRARCSHLNHSRYQEAP